MVVIEKIYNKLQIKYIRKELFMSENKKFENITEKKRNELLSILNECIKNGTALDNDSYSLIKLYNFIEQNSTYGLRFDEFEEEFEKYMKHDDGKSNGRIPILEEVEEKRIGNFKDKNVNFIIEGDNLHALNVLQKTHIDENGKGLIDVIYIDPPYNTTKTSFQYIDTFEHSHWASNIFHRLLLSKKILKDDGIIFISIDDNEQSSLKLICDKVFGQEKGFTSIK